MSRQEFWTQVRKEVEHGDMRVITKREHQLLLDIAAMAQLIASHKHWTKNMSELDPDLLRRLNMALRSYKIVSGDEHRTPPPSTNAREEETLMEIPQ